jgi:hypothetical protein
MANDDWKQVDHAALIKAVGQDRADGLWALYENSKAAYRAYKAERDTFQAGMQADFADKMPKGMELKFGYNFGKLSIAVGPVTERKVLPKAESESLGNWLASQASSGRSC